MRQRLKRHEGKIALVGLALALALLVWSLYGIYRHYNPAPIQYRPGPALPLETGTALPTYTPRPMATPTLAPTSPPPTSTRVPEPIAERFVRAYRDPYTENDGFVMQPAYEPVEPKHFHLVNGVVIVPVVNPYEFETGHRFAGMAHLFVDAERAGIDISGFARHALVTGVIAEKRCYTSPDRMHASGDGTYWLFSVYPADGSDTTVLVDGAHLELRGGEVIEVINDNGPDLENAPAGRNRSVIARVIRQWDEPATARTDAVFAVPAFVIGFDTNCPPDQLR